MGFSKNRLNELAGGMAKAKGEQEKLHLAQRLEASEKHGCPGGNQQFDGNLTSKLGDVYLILQLLDLSVSEVGLELNSIDSLQRT